MTELVAVGLAAWRVARLLTREGGPWDTFEGLRRLLGVPAEGLVEGFLPTLATCIYCLSFWTALTLAGVWEIEPRVVIFLAAWAVPALIEDYKD